MDSHVQPQIHRSNCVVSAVKCFLIPSHLSECCVKENSGPDGVLWMCHGEEDWKPQHSVPHATIYYLRHCLLHLRYPRPSRSFVLAALLMAGWLKQRQLHDSNSSLATTRLLCGRINELSLTLSLNAFSPFYTKYNKACIRLPPLFFILSV